MARAYAALAIAINQGFVADTSDLADISDRLLSITDATTLQAEATKIFGKNWVYIMPLLEKGGGLIRELGHESERTSRELQDLRKSNDALGQSITLTDEELKNAVSGIDLYAKALGKSDIAWSEQIRMIQDFAAELGIANASTLTFATDMEFINQALTATSGHAGGKGL